MTRAFSWHNNFDPVTLTFQVKVNVKVFEKNLNVGHIFFIIGPIAPIFHMCIPCDKTFHLILFLDLYDLDLKGQGHFK